LNAFYDYPELMFVVWMALHCVANMAGWLGHLVL